ncbi:MAG: YeaH/YhbH family protein [Acidobacteriota bacterium]
MADFVFREWQPSDAQRSDRSAGDRARHRQKIREAIRENIADIVSEESIIGQSGERIVKVPIRGLKEYQFAFGDNVPRVGQGDGDTRPGQVLGSESSGKGMAKAGDRPGVDYYETEITLEELIDILFEDLELPYQERKKLRQTEVESKRKYLGYRRKDIRARLSLRRSAIERIRRLQKTRQSAHLLQRDVLEAERKAESEEQLGQAREAEKHRLQAAQIQVRLEEMKRLLDGIRDPSYPKSAVDPSSPARFPFRKGDMRFHHRRERPRPQSNAVVICIMDTSGSMDMTKKYLARTFFFLLHRFVSVKYDSVETVFVSHHTEAREVTEEEFFHKGESGGTFISSGYNKALEIIQDRYHPSLWNLYAFHCSDGDNFDSDNAKTLAAARQLCQLCNLFGYGEIKPHTASGYESSLLEFFSKRIEADNFQTILIEKKEDVWPAFKGFLQHEVRP